ncbi:uncharacterized protein V1518DRAFT_449556 [Limtongia smithiae]|uniref:uncharacterized protein n=1 Tax=Limtongia smithiae TaxID=1125753 RepID=UPI0034CD4EE0
MRWTCTAVDMPEEFMLDTTEVKCEGYESTDVPFILRGSFAVRYGIYLTAVGHARYSKHKSRRSSLYLKFVSDYLLGIILEMIIQIQAVRRQRAKRIAQMDLDAYSTLDNQ